MNAPTSSTVRNAAAYTVAELFWGFAWALSVDFAMTAPFSDGFGGSEAFVGTATLVSALSLGLPTLLTAFWVEPMRHKRLFVFWGHMVGALVLGVLAAFIGLAGDAEPAAVRLAYLVGLSVFFASVGFLIPGWLALVGELFSRGTQARVLGITFMVNRTGALAGGLVTGAVLQGAWRPTDQWSLLFGCAAAAALIGSLPFLWIVERPIERPRRSSFRRYVRGLATAFRDLPALRRFIAADLLGVTAFVALVFYPDAAIRGEGFQDERAGDWIMLAAGGQIIASGAVAALGERVLPRRWFVAAALAGALCAVMGAIGGSAEAYGAAAVLAGIYMGLRITCHAPQVMRLAPDRDGTAPLGLAVACVMLVQALAPYAAGLLIPGVGYAAVFAAVALLCVLSAALLGLWLPRAPGVAATGR